MIPADIAKEHILLALGDINERGIPPGREATKYALEHAGRLYPPKLVVSLAARHARGSELAPSTFSGGQETNQFLDLRGFRIVEVQAKARREAVKPLNPAIPRELPAPHTGERCPACKARVGELLKALFGRVEENHSLHLGALPGDYEGTPHHDALRAIYARLVAHRGFADFVRARGLSPCDYFVPDPGFILEFDEKQHFTVPRSVTLDMYPNTLPTGFDRNRWKALCQQIEDRDPDPPYRDEQRAWYDTLRDFASTALGLRPTVRLYARQTEWCQLDPKEPADLERFRRLVEVAYRQQHLSIRVGREAAIARLIIRQEWPGDANEARALLEQVAREWPQGPRVEFLVTCGGFVQFPLSEAVPLEGLHRDSETALEAILRHSVQVAHEVVPDVLRCRLREHVRYITVGIDTYKSLISTTRNRISEPHAETIVVLDLDTGQHHVTAKSYPTTAQERGLLRVKDLESHFLDLDGGVCAMVLGCHDLNVWNPRSSNARRSRAELNRQFRELALRRQPTVVLHHPHTADSTRTWRAAWTSLERELPSVRLYAGAGRHWHHGGARSPLDETLALTKKGSTLDFVLAASAPTSSPVSLRTSRDDDRSR